MKRNPSEPGSFDEVTGLCWGGKIVKLLADKKSATNCETTSKQEECNKLCAHHFCPIMLVSKICTLVTLAMPIYIYIYINNEICVCSVQFSSQSKFSKLKTVLHDLLFSVLIRSYMCALLLWT